MTSKREQEGRQIEHPERPEKEDDRLSAAFNIIGKGLKERRVSHRELDIAEKLVQRFDHDTHNPPEK
jgi:hypothetical protein